MLFRSKKKKKKKQEITQIRNSFTKNKKLPNKNKQETQIHSQNIKIYASSQSRLTQALYQTHYEQYFETLKFKEKSLQIRNPPTNNMLLPHKITINKKLPNKITILRPYLFDST